jgi:hypothetical protein
MAAATVFSEMQRKHGDSVIPALQSVARAMAKDGSYPYDAMAPLIQRGWRRDEKRGDNNDDAPSEQATSVFRDAFQAYQSAPARSNDEAFTQFITRVWRSVPRDLATEAVDTLARSLMTAEPDARFSGEIQLNNSRVKLNSPSDAALLQIMRVLKELDPAMLAKVMEAKPDFAGAEDGRMNGMRTSFSSANVPQQARSQLDQMRARRNSMRLARTDPDKALATASAMTDAGDKATLLAQTAASMAQKSPEDAAKVLDQAQKIAADVKDQATELRIIVSCIQAARQLNQAQRVHELMARGFDLGAQLMRKQMDEHPDGTGTGEALGYMTALVSFGIVDDPDAVTATIDALPYPLAKAMLYTTAARSMQFNRFRRDSAMTGEVIGGYLGATFGAVGGTVTVVPAAPPR